MTEAASLFEASDIDGSGFLDINETRDLFHVLFVTFARRGTDCLAGLGSERDALLVGQWSEANLRGERVAVWP